MGTVYDMPVISSADYGIAPPSSLTYDEASCRYMRDNGLLLQGTTASNKFVAKGTDISGVKLAAYSVHDGRVYWIIAAPGRFSVANSTTVELDNAGNRSANWAGYFDPPYYGSNALLSSLSLNIDLFDSEEEALRALGIGTTYPITYRPTNCSFPNAPTEAAVGDTVNVSVTFPEGYGLVNESNIYVTNNGVVIPSTYSNGQLTFTMPDPS